MEVKLNFSTYQSAVNRIVNKYAKENKQTISIEENKLRTILKIAQNKQRLEFFNLLSAMNLDKEKFKSIAHEAHNIVLFSLLQPPKLEKFVNDLENESNAELDINKDWMTECKVNFIKTLNKNIGKLEQDLKTEYELDSIDILKCGHYMISKSVGNLYLVRSKHDFEDSKTTVGIGFKPITEAKLSMFYAKNEGKMIEDLDKKLIAIIEGMDTDEPKA